jgi:Fe-S-cluster-containing dehydrogenase component
MEVTRRSFLKLAGAAAAIILIKPATDLAQKVNLPQKSSAAVSAGLVAKRWAMAINTKACKQGCQICIDTCHSIHNVPDFGNAKDEIKWLFDLPYGDAFPDTENQFLPQAVQGSSVLALCNHCDNPPCVRVCPTQATFRREDGIVMMDYHRCIGCRYCMAACPYGARSFNWRDPRPFIKTINPDYPTRTRGVVEKCNFCQERLAIGQIPACVEVCPEKALVFGDLEDPNSEISALLQANFSLQRKSNLGTRPQVYYLV